MKVMWCWRCRMEIPMLEPDEARQVWGMHFLGWRLSTAVSHRIFDQCGDRHLVDERLVFEHESGGMLREYERITGLHETSPAVMYHHLVGLYGPPCGSR